jgi:hypothetical protein
MTRRFVVAVDGLTPDAEASFRKYIDDIGAGFWHWIPNFWLLVIDDDEIAAEAISNKLHDMKASRNLVLEFPRDLDWKGWGRKNARGKNMFEWLETTWAENDKK